MSEILCFVFEYLVNDTFRFNKHATSPLFWLGNAIFISSYGKHPFPNTEVLFSYKNSLSFSLKAFG